MPSPRSPRVLLGALAVCLSLPMVRADDREPIGATAPTTHAKFGGRRRWIDSLSTTDQALLAKLILEYTSLETDSSGVGRAVRVHSATMSTPSLTNVHRADYSQLFSWHRTYIAGLERFLVKKGYAKFVPLPKWDPATPIPKIFGKDRTGKSAIVVYDPKIDWRAFETKKLSAFTEDARKGPKDTTPASKVLADTLVSTHNTTHNTVGGTMSSMQSPSVPIFWLYHAFIDDVDYDWQHLPPPPKGDGPLMAPAPGTRGGPEPVRLTGEVRAGDKGIFLDTASGPVALSAGGGQRAALEAARGRTVWLDATQGLDGTKVHDVLAESRSMTPISVRSEPPRDLGFLGVDFGFLRTIVGAGSKEVGKIQPMDEVKVVGSKDGWLEVVVNDQIRGWVPASSLAVGQPPAKASAPSHTHGLTGAMKGMDAGCCAKGDCSSCSGCGAGKCCCR